MKNKSDKTKNKKIAPAKRGDVNIKKKDSVGGNVSNLTPAKKAIKENLASNVSKERPRKYEPKESQKTWIDFWNKNDVYAFNPAVENIFSIDTPPPYPSGDFHIGNVLNWCYFDFVARYKRMKGFNVHFPQGWDVHGLPTESKVEQWKGKKSSEVPAETWVKWCNEWSNKYIAEMKKMIKLLGVSCDWATEYRTSDIEYIKMVQLSFLKLVKKGLAYRGKHPINWCTNCGTAIADAEVEHKERDARLYTIKFLLSGEGEIVIATTRPELLPACVGIAVNPEDHRYKEIISRRAIVPVFNQEVDIFASTAVNPEFGTGIVMICSFGDKQDVEWIMKHQLPVIEAIDEHGMMTRAAGRFVGMNTTNAKKEIVRELTEKGFLLGEDSLKQSVGICWRCKTPIEIMNKEQWFLRATQMNDFVIEATHNAKWHPDYMKLRQIQWASSMDWDWVVSRQKVYGTPIPVWYCKKCDSIVFADENELPIDPSAVKKKCDKCKGDAMGERDRFDTWMDSSMTTYWHAGWPSRSSHPSHKKSPSSWEKMIPADLQPNGTDIIRTWDYYLMLRSLMLTKKPAYKSVLVNGMVLGEDGRKMSKSLGNYVTAKDALEKSSVDAIRYWTTRGSVGSDLPFSWKEVQHAEKFYNKIFNVFQFSKMHLKTRPIIKSVDELEIVDRWILTRLQKLTNSVTNHFENYQFNEAMNAIEVFVWHELADYYIEMAKHRLYGNDERNKRSAQFTLYTCLFKTIKLLAPFAPYITENVYQDFFRKFEKGNSIHMEKWPTSDQNLVNTEAEKLGELAVDVISAIRQFKTSRKMPMNAPLRLVTIEQEDLLPLMDDIKGTMKIEQIKTGRAEEILTEKFNIGLKIEV